MNIDNLNNKSINNYIPIYYSYLNQSIINEDLNSITKIIEKGGNVNGVTVNGITTKIPLTCVNFKSGNFETIVRLLLKNGADINKEDLTGDTILTCYISYILKNNILKYENYNKIFLFLLERGANPNGTIFCNPLIAILNYMLTTKTFKFYPLIEMLISFNANPKYSTITLVQTSKNLKSSSYEIYSHTNSLKFLSPLFDISVDEIIDKCESEQLIKSLSIFYKIPYTTKSHVCKCIKTIISNKKDYNEDTFSELRKKKRKNTCHNDDLIIGYPIDSFTDNELVYLKDKTTKKEFTYCFHVSEIPMLLSNQINPFNNKPLDPKFIEDLVIKYKYFIPKTLEETLDNLFIYEKTIIDNNILINKLGEYIKTFNSYIQTDRIKELNINNLIELQNMIYEGNNNNINLNILPSDRLIVPNKSEAENKDYILERTLTHLFIYLNKHVGSLPLISNIIDQLLKDYEVAKDIISLFSINKKFNIINFINRNDSYNDFLNNIDKIILNSQYDVNQVILDSKFRNSLNEDQLAIIDVPDVLEFQDFIELYKNHIKSSIDDLLKKRFDEDYNLNNGWRDIIPVLLRV